MRNRQIIIPSVLQKEVLDQLYTGHHRIQKCCDQAKQAFWWLGLQNFGTLLTSFTHSVFRNHRQQNQCMILSPFPELPWQR